jgi:hypothetical protein
MRLFSPRCAVLLGCLALVARPSLGAIVDRMTIEPPHPTKFDPVEITISGTSPTSCFDLNTAAVVRNNLVLLRGGDCPFDPVPPGSVPYTFHFVVGPLAPGPYVVQFLVDSFPGTAAQADLFVEDSAPFPATALRLFDNRFHVEIAWQLPSGTAGKAQPVRFTDNAGYFWFFDASNAEVVVKVVDGRVVNGHFWLFYGGLSDVAYTVTVTDTQAGKTKTYSNLQGSQAGVSDTDTF